MVKNCSKKAEKLWVQMKNEIDNDIKDHLLDNYANQILNKYEPKIKGLVNKYLYKLPYHVSTMEGDDLANIARIGFLETIKRWQYDINSDVWPLAYSRINGAMKDHLRYLTKASPERLYDWITDAAYLYLQVETDNSFEEKIENGVTLDKAMTELSEREKAIIFSRFKDDKTFKDIGDQIGLSESQITRIYKSTIKKLRKVLSEK